MRELILKFLRNKLFFGTRGCSIYTLVPALVQYFFSCSLLFTISIVSCSADNSAARLKELKAGRYDFFLKADNATYRSIKGMGRASAYYVGLHLKRAGYGQAARFYFALGEKLYEAPFNRLCRNELYETGNAADCLQSVQKRLQELTKPEYAAEWAEKDRLLLLENRLLLQTGAYDKITRASETLYLTGTLTAELVDAFPQLGKNMAPLFQKLAEIRIYVFEKRYAEAWEAIRTGFGTEYTLAGLAFAGLSFPALISDIGKAGLYGAAETAAAADFFENLAAQIPKALSQEHFSNGQERRAIFYALFYAARCRVKIGAAEQREQAVTLFLQAVEQADTVSDFDSAMWYYLDTLRMLRKARYLTALAETAAQWRNPAWYADLVQAVTVQLTAAQDWAGLQKLYEALCKTDLPEQRAAVSYILARSGALPYDQTVRLLQEAGGSAHDSFYYRIVSAYRLGGDMLLERIFHPRTAAVGKASQTDQNRTEMQEQAGLRQTDAAQQSDFFVQPQNSGVQTADAFSPQDARVYIDGLLHFGLFDMVYPQFAALSPLIPIEEASRIALSLQDEGRYADSIRVISLSLKKQEGAAADAQLHLLYPRPWKEIVARYAAEYRLPEYLLYALIRSESFFQPQVVSGAGAVGLTQLMPATAADIAKKLKVTDYDLTDPEINIRFGAYYLAEMIRRSDNRIMPACFAYNAGISRVRSWQRHMQGFSEDLFLESLDYAETRGYGRKMLVAAVIYGSLYYSEKPEDIVRAFFPNG